MKRLNELYGKAKQLGEDMTERLGEIVEKTNVMQAQEWLDKNYPKEKRRRIVSLGINGYDWDGQEEKDWNKLEGNLDLSDFINLKVLDCSSNKLTKLVLDNCLKLSFLNCSQNKLTELDLSNNLELEKLYCGVNELKELNLSFSIQLKELECCRNYLENLEFLEQLDPEELINLNIIDNCLPKQDLTVFSEFVNLKELSIGGTSIENLSGPSGGPTALIKRKKL